MTPRSVSSAFPFPPTPVLSQLRPRRPGRGARDMRAHERDDFSAHHDAQRLAGDRQTARAGRDVLSTADRELHLDRRWSEAELAAAGELATDGGLPGRWRAPGSTGLAELAAGPQLLNEQRDAAAAVEG